MPSNSTRNVLIAGVRREWGKVGLDWRANSARQAQIAVDEVIDALRANPGWARALGIGDPR